MSVCICICLFLANICPAVCLSSQRERANNNNTKKREEREEGEGKRRERRERRKNTPDCVHMCNRSSSRSGHLFLVMATPREGTRAGATGPTTHTPGRAEASQQPTDDKGNRNAKKELPPPAQDNHHHGTIAAATASFSWFCLAFLEDSSGSAHGKTSCLLLLDGSIVLDT